MNTQHIWPIIYDATPDDPIPDDNAHTHLAEVIDWCSPFADKAAWTIATHTIINVALGVFE